MDVHLLDQVQKKVALVCLRQEPLSGGAKIDKKWSLCQGVYERDQAALFIPPVASQTL